MPAEWTLKPGDRIERKELHSIFGGRTQGGIGPSAKTANVFVFTHPVAGEKHGYYDEPGCRTAASITAERDSTETSG